jgi:hypothetical protein
MMDQATFETFARYAVPGTPAPVQDLSLLPEEQALYHWLAERNMRLEQERIPMAHALPQIERALRGIHHL